MVISKGSLFVAQLERGQQSCRKLAVTGWFHMLSCLADLKQDSQTRKRHLLRFGHFNFAVPLIGMFNAKDSDLRLDEVSGV